MKSTDSSAYLGYGTVTPIVNGTTFLRDIDVKADLYIKGDYYINEVKQFPNGQTLTATFDITPYGNPDPVMSSNLVYMNSSNYALQDMELLERLILLKRRNRTQNLIKAKYESKNN